MIEGGEGLGPASVKRRDPEVWWPAARIARELATLADEAGVEVQRYGTTAGGLPLDGALIGNAERCVAWVGLMHAGESGPELMLPVVRRLLRESPEVLEKCGVAVLPAVCGDERERMVRGVPYYRRANLRGVDLNRNFPAGWDVVSNSYGADTSDPKSGTYRGPGPASEPETQAVIRFLESVRPRAVFSMHWLAGIAADRWLGPASAAQDAGHVRRCDEIWSAFSAAFRAAVPGKLPAYEMGAGVPGGPLGPGIGHNGEGPWATGVEFIGSGGTLPAWVYAGLGVPGFDVEHYNDQPGQVPRFDRTTVATLEEYRQRWVEAMGAVLEVVGGLVGGTYVR